LGNQLDLDALHPLRFPFVVILLFLLVDISWLPRLQLPSVFIPPFPPGLQ
jgi:hypothetical protein